MAMWCSAMSIGLMYAFGMAALRLIQSRGCRMSAARYSCFLILKGPCHTPIEALEEAQVLGATANSLAKLFVLAEYEWKSMSTAQNVRA